MKLIIRPETKSNYCTNGTFFHAAGLPNITGAFDAHTKGNVSGVFALGGTTFQIRYYPDSWNEGKSITFYANRSSAIYGKSTTVQPTSFCTQYLIKYWVQNADGCTVVDFE